MDRNQVRADFFKNLKSSMEGARRLMANDFVQVKVPFQHQSSHVD